MSKLNLRSIDVGFCLRCQGMAVEIPEDATSCEYDKNAPCVDESCSVHSGHGLIECASREELIKEMRTVGFIVKE